MKQRRIGFGWCETDHLTSRGRVTCEIILEIGACHVRLLTNYFGIMVIYQVYHNRFGHIGKQMTQKRRGYIQVVFGTGRLDQYFGVP